MKTDDPRLEVGRKAMEERVKKFNDLMLATLKGHLVVEQALDSFLASSLSNADHIRGIKLTFNHKAQLCRALSFDQERDGLWDVVRAANRLRNQVAHDLNIEKIQTKMDELRKVYLGTLTPKQAKGLEEESDPSIVESACVLCAGFFATIEDDAKGRRGVVDKHWKPRG
ncbi:MAG: hypothetical protein KIT48_21040 [Pseudolabrys sp.]|nr:hypothetical protein [Pseudolabrys sp.]